MFKVLNGVACPGATASADPWIPLTVSWAVSLRGGPLYLYVRGDDGGYVELKVDPDSGALYALVIVDLPQHVDRSVKDAPTKPDPLSPVFDLGLWEWKNTPDYKESAKRDTDATSTLAYSTPGNLFALWFSGSPVSSYLECGAVRVGVSDVDELVGIVVNRPPVIEPVLTRG
ncbi:hypothetical protein Ais01nite_74100 [Asanoa ishikariensis]|uniref:Uncharacterized protein n=1 Tax=Asanoa ishikariensis TaxID=137265 RepID=A0A1H3UTF3_9ACTN|nr:hypothetical protein [Asanoa ishikariensis]GIF69375.1 hypothetical protein Ais01nite_74100 [Asanoa ishikariensis]SDZ65125.1 hypothetical protein SAMN05421684_7935 [Asanoa ishikariensis]